MQPAARALHFPAWRARLPDSKEPAIVFLHRGTMLFKNRHQPGEIYLDPAAAPRTDARRKALKLTEARTECVLAILSVARISDVGGRRFSGGRQAEPPRNGSPCHDSGLSGTERGVCDASLTDCASASSLASLKARSRNVLASLTADWDAASSFTPSVRCRRPENRLSALRRAASRCKYRGNVELSMDSSTRCGIPVVAAKASPSIGSFGSSDARKAGKKDGNISSQGRRNHRQAIGSSPNHYNAARLVPLRVSLTGGAYFRRPLAKAL